MSRVIVVQFVSIDGITEDPYRTRAGTRLQSTTLQGPSTRQSACALKGVASNGQPNCSRRFQRIDLVFNFAS